MSTAEVYDPRTATFASAGAMTYIAERTLAIRLSDGRVIVFEPWGQSDMDVLRGLADPAIPAEIWDPTSGTFSASVKLPHAMSSATLLDDGRIFLSGMLEPVATWSGVLDLRTGDTVTTQATRAWSPTATRVADGRVLLVGGLAPETVTTDGSLPGSKVPTVEIFQ